MKRFTVDLVVGVLVGTAGTAVAQTTFAGVTCSRFTSYDEATGGQA